MKKNNIFWISYSDLMTSLFFIMLVLFVTSISYLVVSKEGVIRERDRLKRLLNLEELFKPLLDDTTNFYYLHDCKKFIAKDLTAKEIFFPNKFDIKPEYIDNTIEVGLRLKVFLDDLQKKNPDLSYLLVIEGNMANTYDQQIDRDQYYGYIISYQRALAVYDLWIKNNINIRNPNVEVMICGSGFNGLCRDDIEENNKRFSIQIIPKVSK